MSTNHRWDIIRLTTRERLELLDALDCGYATGYAHRANSYRPESVTVIVEHHPGIEMAYVVCPRMISVTGLWFIHGGYLHPGTKIKVYLPTLTGGVECFTAHVERCRLVLGNVHDVHVAFNLSVEIDDFLPPNPTPPPEATLPDSLLIIEPDAVRSGRMREILSEHEVDVEVVSDLADTMDVIERQRPRVVATTTTARRARAVMKSLRIFGHNGGVVALLPPSQVRHAAELHSAGFAAAVTWPLAKRQFIAALRVASGAAQQQAERPEADPPVMGDPTDLSDARRG